MLKDNGARKAPEVAHLAPVFAPGVANNPVHAILPSRNVGSCKTKAKVLKFQIKLKKSAFWFLEIQYFVQ